MMTGITEPINLDLKICHNKAKEALKLAKEQEKKRDLISIRVDEKTIKLMPREKAIKLGLI